MTLQLSADAVAPKAETPQKYLFGPVTDFLMLGGSAFLILPVLFLVPLEYEGPLAATMVIVAYLVNYPHFAHSYQLFYRNFGRKVTGTATTGACSSATSSRALWCRWLMAGFFAYGAAGGEHAPARLRHQRHVLFRRLALRQAGLRHADGGCSAEAQILRRA